MITIQERREIKLIQENNYPSNQERSMKDIRGFFTKLTKERNHQIFFPKSN